MPSKYQEYRQMADTAERQLTSSYKSWTQFLRTAARLYKYPYNEQVMIHAQRPDATACAEYDFWNKKMGRFVRRGSTGIALIDTSGQKPQLRYVFDVADTGEREHSRPMHLWQFRTEHEDAVAAALERNYGYGKTRRGGTNWFRSITSFSTPPVRANTTDSILHSPV